MKKSEIRLMGMDDLNARLLETRGEYMTLRFQAVSGQLTDTSKLRQMRRLIAKFETIKREKQFEKDSEGAA